MDSFFFYVKALVKRCVYTHFLFYTYNIRKLKKNKFFINTLIKKKLFLEHTDHFDKTFSLFHSFNAIWSTRKKHPTKIKMVILSQQGCRDVIYDYSR